MFDSLQPAPPDAILGLTEAFLNDLRPEKINLSVGVYQDERGATPALRCVAEAERRLADTVYAARSASSSPAPLGGYLPIEGLAAYRRGVQELLFGVDHPVRAAQRAATLQTPGGTAALRLAADLVRRLLPTARLWCSQPTWPNHASVFAAAGLPVEIYPYFDPHTNRLDTAGMLDALARIPPGHVVCLHAGCHNPTGVDPTPDEWSAIAELLGRRNVLPLLDFAYQGFGEGVAEDAAVVETFCGEGRELLVASSFSKNFGLYAERVGALTIVGGGQQDAAAALSHAKTCVRASYSNPPAHGARVVATVLDDPPLRRLWRQEVDGMRQRIQSMRERFVASLEARLAGRDFSYLRQQRGMFSFAGLTPLAVDRLRSEYGVYVVGNGRINVAGMTPENIERVCEAIAAVL